MDHHFHILRHIKNRIIVRKFLIVLCFMILVFGLASFVFYAFDKANNAIKFISKEDQIKKVEKVMIHPKIKFEHKENEFFDIQAQKAIHKDKNDIELFDVKISGNKGNITAGNLLITNNGNNLHFSNNPVLIIKEIQK